MLIKLLCVGDVVGSPGRSAVIRALPKLVADTGIHCTVVNAENAASGSGITPTQYAALTDAGVDLITMGDHIYRRSSIIEVLEKSERIVRPANFSPSAPGRSFTVYQAAGGHRIALFSLLGRMYMRVQSDCPFRAADRVLTAIPDDVRIIVVDMHAEATSEKVAMGWHLNGRVSAVFGTHTHVPTADECVLPGGTAYITDLGMTGPHDSVLGRKKDRVLRSLTTNVPARFEVATGDVRLSGAVVEIDSTTGRARSIQRVCVDGGESPANLP